jgi:hypothetical protein
MYRPPEVDATQKEDTMARRKLLAKGEVEFWRGRQWQVTTLGVGMIKFPWTWLHWDVVRRNWDEPKFNKYTNPLTWMATRYDTDVEDCRRRARHAARHRA